MNRKKRTIGLLGAGILAAFAIVAVLLARGGGGEYNSVGDVNRCMGAKQWAIRAPQGNVQITGGEIPVTGFEFVDIVGSDTSYINGRLHIEIDLANTPDTFLVDQSGSSMIEYQWRAAIDADGKSTTGGEIWRRRGFEYAIELEYASTTSEKRTLSASDFESKLQVLIAEPNGNDYVHHLVKGNEAVPVNGVPTTANAKLDSANRRVLIDVSNPSIGKNACIFLSGQFAYPMSRGGTGVAIDELP